MTDQAQMWAPEIETLDREAMRRLQGERLRKQLDYVYANSPFYRRRFDEGGIAPGDIRGVEDIALLPFTTKQDLRAEQEQHPPYGGHASASARDITWLPTTSGTSGTPLLLPKTNQDVETWTELNARAFTTAGITHADTYQNILGYHWLNSGVALHLGAQRVGATVINAGMGNTEKQLWALTTLGVTAMHATPSYLMHLGSLLSDGRAEQLALRTIISGGEVGMGTAEGKARLRELFPTVTTFADVGGATDIGTMIWAECPLMNGAHIAEDAVLWELLDPETLAPVAPGEVGELVVTDLVSAGAPLIRYRLRDLARIDTSPCGCGRTTSRFDGGLQGRSDDMVTIRSANVFPSAIDAVLKGISDPSIDNYQFVVDRVDELDTAVLRIEFSTPPAPSAQERVKQELASAFRVLMGGRVDIVIVDPGTLPVFAWKAMRLIDRRKGQNEEQAAALARSQAGA